MSIGSLILGVNSVMVSYLICYDSLLQKAADIIQNATAILLQNATEVYYKVRQVFYDKMRQLLQNVTFITNCDSTNIVIFSTAVVGTIVLQFSAGKQFTFTLFFLSLFFTIF